MIGTALDLILVKVREIGLDISIPTPTTNNSQPVESVSVPSHPGYGQAVAPQTTGLDDIDMTEVGASPSLLKTASSLEPVSVRVAAMDCSTDRPH